MSAEAMKANHLHQAGEYSALLTLRNRVTRELVAAKAQRDLSAVRTLRNVLGMIDSQRNEVAVRMEGTDLGMVLEMSRRGATL